MVAQQLTALAKETRATGPLDELLQQAREGAERVRTIVRDLKTFSHPDDEAVKPVDLHRVVRSSINLASVEIRERASLRSEFGVVPYVLGNEARLGQVFINLLLNAAQATLEGARTATRSTSPRAATPRATSSSWPPPPPRSWSGSRPASVST
jgi:two-component system, cell cycle sensor histidine kinase and response regulator CckA